MEVGAAEAKQFVQFSDLLGDFSAFGGLIVQIHVGIKHQNLAALEALIGLLHLPLQAEQAVLLTHG